MPLPKDFLKAMEIVPHLIQRAKERRTITYGELGELVDYPAYFLTQPLDALRDRILLEHRLPRLDALVVNKETNEVGDSFHADGFGDVSMEERRALLDDEREKVYAYESWDERLRSLRAHYGLG